MTDPASDPATDPAPLLGALAERRAGRRRFLRQAGGAGVGAGALALLAGCGAGATSTTTSTAATTTTVPVAISDADVLNFALNLEFLEAAYYSYAAFGAAPSVTTTGVGTPGTVTGGLQVAFTDPLVAAYARELAADEAAHVNFIQKLLTGSGGTVAVAQPAINIDGRTAATGAFALAAQAAGIAAADGTFDPYASDESFLLGAFLLEDVGVSAYQGAAALLTNKTYLDAAAGILATEAYHAGLIRSVLYRKGLDAGSTLLGRAQALSDARDGLDGAGDDDQGVGTAAAANVTPTDNNGLGYARSTGQVLNIAYLTKATATKGGFFPAGLNGNIFASAASG